MVSKSVVIGLRARGRDSGGPHRDSPTLGVSTQTLTPPRSSTKRCAREQCRWPPPTPARCKYPRTPTTGYPVAPVYRNYPVYHPDKEPAGYFASLEKVEPETAFDAAALKTTADWIKAGELVFDAPIALVPPAELRDPFRHQRVAMPLKSTASP